MDEDPCTRLTRLRTEWAAIRDKLENQIVAVRWQVRSLDSFSIRPDDVQDKAHGLESLLRSLEAEKLNYRDAIMQADRDCDSYKALPALSAEILPALPLPAPEPPNWESIKRVAEDYERNGHDSENQNAFAKRHHISKTTLVRYLKIYEAHTGKQVRPGQGRAKMHIKKSPMSRKSKLVDADHGTS